jgi:hypothetical protein
MKEEGHVCEYLGIQIKRHKDVSMTLMPPQLIELILKDLNLEKDNVKERTAPALKSVLLHKDKGGKAFCHSFEY